MSQAQDFTPGCQQGSYEGRNVAIISTEWHRDIVEMLVCDAEHTLGEADIQVEHYVVPGSFELPQAASFILQRRKTADITDPRGEVNNPQRTGRPIDGIICFGVVVQGDTPHFTFISQAVANSLEQIACHDGQANRVPVMFGVLTTNTVQQARDRADGTHSRKGVEVAQALIRMFDFQSLATGMRWEPSVEGR